MTARYLLTLTDDAARVLEGWLGGQLWVTPAAPPRVDPVPGGVLLSPQPRHVTIGGLDAITDDEAQPIRVRLGISGPLYHAGGPR
jgi:hypothetical protein